MVAALSVEKPLIGGTNTTLEVEGRRPAEVAEPADVQHLARCPVGLRDVKSQFDSWMDDGANHLGQVPDREIDPRTDIDVLIVAVVAEKEEARIGEVFHVEELAHRSPGSPDLDLLGTRSLRMAAGQDTITHPRSSIIVSAPMSPPVSQRAVVVVPAFNEVETVAAVVAVILQVGLPVVVVDDGSTDGTARAARAAGASVLELPFNLGIGGAIRAGFRWAVDNGYEIAVQCDADGQHNPAELPRMIKHAIEHDLHLLIGTRFAGTTGFQATRIRRVPMRLLARVASRAAGGEITDSSSGFRVVRAPLLDEFALKYPIHYLESFEVLVQAGRHDYHVAEIPVSMHERQGGVRSAGTFASLRYLARVFGTLLIGSGQKYRMFEGDVSDDK